MKTKSVLKTVVMTVALLNSLSAMAAEPDCGTQGSLDKVNALAVRELTKFEKARDEQDKNPDPYQFPGIFKGISDLAKGGGSIEFLDVPKSENPIVFYQTRSADNNMEAAGLFQCDANSGKITLINMYVNAARQTDHAHESEGANIRGLISE